MNDLVRLFGELIQSKVDLAPNPSIEIYPGVTYLMPLKDAVKTLGLTESLPSRNLVVCPGFPRESFYYHTFKGIFLDGYTLMNIVVDRADQVACIQLVAEAPRPGQFAASYSDDDGYLAYNFVNYRVKAIKRLRIEHKIDYFAQDSSPGWEQWSRINLPSYPFNLIRISTVLYDPEYRGNSSQRRTLEAVRWYLPVPMAQLILHCIKNSINSRS